MAKPKKSPDSLAGQLVNFKMDANEKAAFEIYVKETLRSSMSREIREALRAQHSGFYKQFEMDRKVAAKKK